MCINFTWVLSLCAARGGERFFVAEGVNVDPEGCVFERVRVAQRYSDIFLRKVFRKSRASEITRVR